MFVTVYGTLIDAETSNVVDSRKKRVRFVLRLISEQNGYGDQPSEPLI